jgi:Xaa-Pro dipeptidase
MLTACRQRRFFFYLSGCQLPDSSLDIDANKLTLFIPPIDPESVIWSGLPLSPQEALALYDVDDVKTTPEVNTTLTYTQSKRTVYAIPGQTSDNVTFLEFGETDFDLLKEAIEECRAVKDEYEIALTVKANQISAVAHTALLKAVKHAENERELEALFIQKCIANGCREQAYHSVVASGTAAATLHYGKNDQPLGGKLNLLVDAGGEYDCYASDIVGRYCPTKVFIKYNVTNLPIDPDISYQWEI